MFRSSIYVYYANKLKTVLFTSFCKESIHYTGYLLIQVEIESVCESHYLHWLVSQSCMLTFLLFGVWLLMDCLQCGCRCRCKCRCRSFCCKCRCRSFHCIFHDFCCLCIFHVFFLSFCKIQN